jgi:hypothetical protein
MFEELKDGDRHFHFFLIRKKLIYEKRREIAALVDFTDSSRLY